MFSALPTLVSEPLVSPDVCLATAPSVWGIPLRIHRFDSFHLYVYLVFCASPLCSLAEAGTVYFRLESGILKFLHLYCVIWPKVSLFICISFPSTHQEPLVPWQVLCVSVRPCTACVRGCTRVWVGVDVCACGKWLTFLHRN